MPKEMMHLILAGGLGLFLVATSQVCAEDQSHNHAALPAQKTLPRSNWPEECQRIRDPEEAALCRQYPSREQILNSALTRAPPPEQILNSAAPLRGLKYKVMRGAKGGRGA
jgi:hypothetical protein